MTARAVDRLYGVKDTYVTKAAIFDLQADDTSGGELFDLGTNPENEEVEIIEAMLFVSTGGVGEGTTPALTVDIGIDDAGDTANDTIFDGVSVVAAAAPKVARATLDAGTHGMKTVGSALAWANGYHIVEKTDATSTGLVGKVVILYRMKVQEGD